MGSFIKRLIDLAGAAVLLAVSSPLGLLAALLIWWEDGRPVLFRQQRVGLDGRAFTLLKFRSMRVNNLSVADVGQVREDNPLLLRCGRFIRRYKIDELPQLINVLRGDMSLVGPRPTIQQQVDDYDAVQRQRLRVRPGLTGWAQVNGGTEVSWNERIALDLWYIENWSLRLDALCLGKTLQVVIWGERANHTVVSAAVRHARRLRACGPDPLSADADRRAA